ncbi:MAG: hypothetical protein H0U74_14100 [Bradymonadaceae bacterium]|nr:hypothetical protein [Lujinxingiaceae bacterium]
MSEVEEPQQETSPTTLRFGKPTIILAAALLLLPALIPLWYAFQAETQQMFFFLLAFSVGILVVNALLLYVIYRWLLLVARG